MNAGEFQRHPVRDHPLLAAGMDEQQVFLPVLEKPEIAAGIALLGRDFEAPRRRHAARHRGGDIGLDPLQRVDGDALALAQTVHQLAVVDGAAAESRLRHIGLAAEFGNLAQDLVVFHRGQVWSLDLGQPGWAAANGAAVLPPSAHRGKPGGETRHERRTSTSSHWMIRASRSAKGTPANFMHRSILLLAITATARWSSPALTQTNAQLGALRASAGTPAQKIGHDQFLRAVGWNKNGEDARVTYPYESRT